MMTFSDLQFIFRFLPLFLAIYYLAPAYARRTVLLVFSLLFYALGDFRFFPLLIAATICNYALGRLAAQKKARPFVLAVALDVALLAAFKTLGATMGASHVPVGVSFYVFKMLSYQADLFAGSISPQPSPIDTAAYFTMFPQVVSGPIMRYEQYAQALAWNLSALKSAREHRQDMLSALEDGAFYFCAGLAAKVVIADHLAMCWQSIGTIGYAHLSTPLAWLGVVCYSLNLYYDFWGYSLMASGICVALGFPFVENFRHPYAAKSVSDYYRRWHMTLGAWFRDYVYIPLGGNRLNAKTTIRNLFVVWLATALWHGFGATFLIWGMSLFLLIVWEKFVLSKRPRLLRVLGRFHVLVLVPLTWIPFAMGNLSYLVGYFHRLFPFAHIPANVYPSDYVSLLRDYRLFFVLGLAFLIPQAFSFLEKNRRHPLIALAMLAVFWISAYSLSNAAGNPFMYFRF